MEIATSSNLSRNPAYKSAKNRDFRGFSRMLRKFRMLFAQVLHVFALLLRVFRKLRTFSRNLRDNSQNVRENVKNSRKNMQNLRKTNIRKNHDFLADVYAGFRRGTNFHTAPLCAPLD